MPRAKLRVSIPESTWIHAVSVGNPLAVFRVISMLTDADDGIVLLEIHERNPISTIADIERRTDVTDFDLLWKRDDTTMVQVAVESPVLLSPVRAAGIPLETPFEIQDGTATWEITTSRDRLAALGEQLEAAGIGYALESVRDRPADPADALLTDRQREVLLAAVNQGYYDTPRGSTLTDVSTSMGITKATGSDILHRAEGKILKWFVDEHVTDAKRVLG